MFLEQAHAFLQTSNKVYYMNQMRGFNRPFGGTKVPKGIKELRMLQKHSAIIRHDHKIENAAIQKRQDTTVTKQPTLRAITDLKRKPVAESPAGVQHHVTEPMRAMTNLQRHQLVHATSEVQPYFVKD